MPEFRELSAGYVDDWGRLMIDGGRRDEVNAAARRILAVRRRYETVAATTGVPWFVIGLLHLREADLSFSTHLHNGDSLKRRTTHVPAGRPQTPEPPYSWEESAIDALRWDRLDRVSEWTIARIAYEAEKYNGFGPRKRGRKSGYLWAGSNIYDGGKFVADGVWDPDHRDRQLGVMVVLSRLRELDESVAAALRDGGRPATRPPTLADANATAPIVTQTTVGTVAVAGAAAPAAPLAPEVVVAVWAVLGLAAALALGLLWRRRARLAAVATAAADTSTIDPEE